NGAGQLGDGSNTNRLSPVPVLGLADATEIVVGLDYTCARRQGGTVSCWGEGDVGQLGDGSGQNRNGPTSVPGLQDVVAVRAHIGFHTCAELSARTVKCWGANEFGQIGDGTTLPHP